MDSIQRENRLVSWRSLHESGGLAASQKYFNEQEASTTLYKSFQISVVPALLQTAEYAEWVITHVEPDLSPSRHLSNSVAARVRRQAILENPNKIFQFVLYEPVLARKLPGDIMKDQIENIKKLAQRENVSIGVIPLDSPKPLIPANTFIIYDDEVVSGVTVSGRLEISDERDVRDYVKHFELLKGAALWDEDLDEFLGQLANR